MPSESLDFSPVTSCAELVHAMAKTTFGGHRLGQTLDIGQPGARDPGRKVVMTLSGAMAVAKQRSIYEKIYNRVRPMKPVFEDMDRV